ncbi:L-ascorbate metabolism protein UlaG, beta-lactamase superfamily [Geodermatophilus dictyosporus]|uniref:L-ascorbate metabolism protein UlaG, beta-lactamase superfamily n=1 Tax=Geodermatophilus dictyosporus TaxID=1523247 RepID=A0A1I5SDF8_9ACTN|nr:MBL fold metallo-hydrolase [Geodermatophilus dictyosporus]SFP68732.1 L-ascorbate metabolism protein UlaG, beta-lactamase superfamily [Geodermatophilus dictyosporus]
MELTKHGHACVVISDGDRRLVVDPGGFTDPAVRDGASAVLVTHEHADHVVPDRLRAALEADPALEVWTNPSVAHLFEGLASRVHAVGDGDTLTAAGFEVQVHGEWHAEIHPDLPRVRNVGFLVEGQVFHPGDALTVPGTPVPTLLLPVHAPWSKVAEVIDYVRAVDADQAFAVHDGLLNDTGLGVVGGLLGERGPGTPTPFSRLAPGESVEL